MGRTHLGSDPEVVDRADIGRCIPRDGAEIAGGGRRPTAGGRGDLLGDTRPSPS